MLEFHAMATPKSPPAGSKWYQLAAGDRAATQQALLTATGGKR